MKEYEIKEYEINEFLRLLKKFMQETDTNNIPKQCVDCQVRKSPFWNGVCHCVFGNKCKLVENPKIRGCSKWRGK